MRFGSSKKNDASGTRFGPKKKGQKEPDYAHGATEQKPRKGGDGDKLRGGRGYGRKG